jgi:acyl-CoA thioester hydrolase
MPSYKTTYRVIYGDTDNMGYAYYANYLRWFEIGRAEMLRSWGLSYKMIETQGIFLPVSEAQCKYMHPVKYDDTLVIETSIDTSFKGAIKFDYRLGSEDGRKIHATGFTKHACIDRNGRVVRPPRFLTEIIEKNSGIE